jgi:TetR/AcrR family transcriptional repressor of nem operon
MADVLERVLPEGDQTQALAALATMVGAVVLARLADSPELAAAILAAARATVTSPACGGTGQEVQRAG